MSPPRSIAELAHEANNYEFAKSVSFRSWVHVAKTILREAEIYRLDDHYEEAYLLYSRFANLVINDLPTHQDGRQPSNSKQLKLLMREVEGCLNKMTTLKPLIEKQLQAYNAAEAARIKRHLLNKQQREKQREEQNHADSNYQYGTVHSSPPEQYAVSLLDDDSSFASALSSLKNLRNSDSATTYESTPSTMPGSWYPSVIPPRSSSLRDTQPDNESPPAVPAKSPSSDVRAPPPSGLEHRVRRTTEGGAPLRSIFLPEAMKDEFLRVAQPNTDRNLETCGILCGKLNRNAFFITNLVIPPQNSTSDTCTTTNEELLFEYVDGNELFILGWIHTHPTQSCFLSSIDLHTQNSYQIMLPEAIAIVCAPSQTPSWGVFRLTDPPGIDIIKSCRHSSTFHPHPEPNIYKSAFPGHVSFKPQLTFQMKDLR